MSTLSNESTTQSLPTVLDFFSDDVAKFKSELRQLEREIPSDAVPQFGDPFHLRMQAAIRDSQDACRRFEEAHQDSPELIKEVQQGFREATEPWLSQSWIANRAHTKPSGFAGDYLMLVKLYEKETPVQGFGAYIDMCISDFQLSHAVRARMVLVREFLESEIASREGDLRILDMASGPCREFENWPAFEGRQIEVVAMDNDPPALEYVQTQVAPKLPPSTTLQAVRYNALRTRNAEATKKKFGTFDIIYSVGLCDYLTDEHLIGIFRGLSDTLNEGGKLVIAFKDQERYDKTPYQWHLDWFFYQRTVEDVLRVYDQAGFDTDEIVQTRDMTGIITNFVCGKKRETFRRIDPAHETTGRQAGRSSTTADEASQQASEN